MNQGVVDQVIGDKEIQQAISVDIRKGRARAPIRALDSSLARNVGEGAIRVVSVEGIAAEIGHVEILVSIVIDIPNGRASAISPVRDTRRNAHICKLPIGSLAVENIGLRARLAGPGGVSMPLDQVEIQQAISIVVEPRRPADHRLGQQLLAHGAVDVQKRDLFLRCHIHESIRRLAARKRIKTA